MGDSDDEWNSANVSANAASNNASSGGAPGSYSNNGGGGANSNNNSNNKRNRDKFYRERDDSANSSGGGGNNGNNYRRDWNDRNRNQQSNDWKNRNPGIMGSGGGYQGGGGGGNSYQRPMNDYTRKYTNPSYSGQGDNTSPQMYKKTRKDWDMGGSDPYGYGSGSGGYGSVGQNSYQKSPDFAAARSQPSSEYPTQPPLLSFKHFLQQQDDGISDDESVRRYNEYKIEFKKTQINNFFLEHKEEDWFKSRYYPDESVKRRAEQNQCVLNRLETFMSLYNDGHLANVSVEADKSKELIRFLDAVVIKLEGGSDEDIKLLDAPPAPVANEEEKKPAEIEEVKAPENGAGETGENGKKRKSEDSGSESGAYSESDNDESHDHKRKKKSKSSSDSAAAAAKSTTTTTVTGAKQLHKTASIFMRNLAPSVTKQDLEELCKSHEGFKRVALSDPAPDRGFFRRGWITFESNVDVKKICWSLQNIKIRGFNPGAIVNRELTSRARSAANNLVCHHKSVVRNDIKIAMKIIQIMDKRWNLWQSEEDAAAAAAAAAATAAEQEEKERAEKEKQQQQGEKEGGGGENGEGSGVNPEDAVFNKSVLSAPQHLKHQFNGPNPLLDKITDYLVDEVSAEEEELLGGEVSAESKEKSAKSGPIELEIDRAYTQALDKLILYLRVVHSLDFYNAIEYQLEDSMPNRCGIVFVRPALPANLSKLRAEDVSEYNTQFEAKMKPYTEYKERIDLELAKKLGLKDIRDEVEKFIKVNTEELAPDRWLCPLSGKKFKGPEFIRKHLFYKHLDKINEVKKEVEFFNGYLFDPKRPQLPEHPSNKQAQSNTPYSSAASSSGSMQQSPGYGNQPMSNQNFQSQPGIMGSPMMGQMYGMMGGNRPMNQWPQQQQPGFMGAGPDMMQAAAYANFNNFGQQQQQQQFQGGGYKNKAYGYGGGGFRRGRDSREMIQYKDLDAPDDN